MRYVVRIAEDEAGYFAQCRAAVAARPTRGRARARLVWSKRFDGSGEALSFLQVAATVAQRLTRRREAARLTALILGRIAAAHRL